MFGKLSGDRDIQGDVRTQDRYIQVFIWNSSQITVHEHEGDIPFLPPLDGWFSEAIKYRARGGTMGAYHVPESVTTEPKYHLSNFLLSRSFVSSPQGSVYRLSCLCFQ